MNLLTAEWVSKAEGDFGTATRELQVRAKPNHDAVCFHAQQCIEKYLKALLQEANVPFGKTHNLVALLDLLLVRHPAWELQRPVLQKLNLFSVQVRYPGESANKAAARKAFEMCSELRFLARDELSLRTARPR